MGRCLPSLAVGLWWPAEGLSGQASSRGHLLMARQRLCREGCVFSRQCVRGSDVLPACGVLPRRLPCHVLPGRLAGAACAGDTWRCCPRVMRGPAGLVAWGLLVQPEPALCGARTRALTAHIWAGPKERSGRSGPAAGRGGDGPAASCRLTLWRPRCDGAEPLLLGLSSVRCGDTPWPSPYRAGWITPL